MPRFSACLILAFLASLPLSAASRLTKMDLESEMPADAHHLDIGDAAPDFSLPGIDGKTYTLQDFKDAPVLMVVFLSNHCPYSHAAETRLLPLYAEMKSRGLAVVAINPNSPAGIEISELGYSKYNDTFAEMKLYARDRGFTFPYLYDGETQKVAKAYGCLCTPHVFLFDRDRRLRYAGRLDDSPYPEASTVTQTDARDAILALLSGQPVKVPMTKPFGCATKWIEKQAGIARINEQWEHTQVTLEKIDSQGIAALLANNTAQYRLINVWATWCIPCVEEFPNLVTLTRQFQGRNFELITVSIDEDANRIRALHFLERQHAALPDRVKKTLAAEGRTTDNYLFEGKLEGLQASLDPEWPGPVPYTLIVAPGGKVIYRRLGVIDLAEVRDKLVDVLSPYYNPAVEN